MSAVATAVYTVSVPTAAVPASNLSLQDEIDRAVEALHKKAEQIDATKVTNPTHSMV